MIRGVEDCKGFMAWQKLHKKYNPRTVARAIRLMAEVASPPAVKDMKDVDSALTKWEGKVRQLRKEFNEGLSDHMRIAIVTAMLPSQVQDFIYTNIDEDAKYELVVEKVRSVVGNKVAMMMGPAPMDVGEVRGREMEEEYEEDWGEDVGAVGFHTRCHRCEGWGHMQRECPTKGKGKGKGKGKDGGYGKGEYDQNKGKGKGPIQSSWQGGWDYGGGAMGKGEKGGGKGFQGKGYQGTCWKCGRVGHKAMECRVRAANEVGEVEAQNDTEIGGVWMIGHVEKEDKREKGEVNICAVEGSAKMLTRESRMRFNVARVKKPLASAAKVVAAGNRIVMSAEEGGSYIENEKSGERLEMRVDRGTYVFDVEYANGEEGTITLDSGAGVNVWPENLMRDVPTQAKEEGLRMIAANGTEIVNLGTKTIKFRGLDRGFSGRV